MKLLIVEQFVQETLKIISKRRGKASGMESFQCLSIDQSIPRALHWLARTWIGKLIVSMALKRVSEGNRYWLNFTWELLEAQEMTGMLLLFPFI